MRVVVDVGDQVKAGQLLAEMDPVDIDERGARTGSHPVAAHDARWSI